MRKYCLLAVLVIVFPASVWAQTQLPNGDFADGLTGWETVADAGARATLSDFQPVQGKACLMLQSANGAAAWAVSSPLPAVSEDNLVLVSFSARRGYGQATLALNLVSKTDDLDRHPLWVAKLPEGEKWQRVSLLLRIPPTAGGEPRLAIGALGQTGAWSVDHFQAAPGKLPATSPRAAFGEPVVTSHVPEGYNPPDLLDAEIRDMGAFEGLYVNVGGIALHVPPSVAISRGARHGVAVYAVNRGQVAKDLQVHVEGPPGVYSEKWTVPVPETTTARFHLALQSLRVGDFTVRVTFQHKDEQASLPIRVTCNPAYPTIGVQWKNTVPAEQLQQVKAVPLSTHVLGAPPDFGALGVMAQGLSDIGAEMIVAVDSARLSPPQFLAGFRQVIDQISPSFWIPWFERQGDETTAVGTVPVMVETARELMVTTGVLSPPVDVHYNFLQGRLEPVDDKLLSAERLGGVMAVTLRPAPLSPPAVLAQQVDGKPDTEGGAWLSLAAETDYSAMRRLLNERGLALPILTVGLQSRSSGDERLDALSLARAMTSIIHNGSTGVVFNPQRDDANGFGVGTATDEAGELRPVPAVMRELGRELAAAVPVATRSEDPKISGAADAQVVYRPFLREGEGIVVLWNNTGTSRDLTLEFNSQPAVAYSLRFAYSGPFVERTWQPIFKFSDEAFQRGQPAIYFRLDPLEVRVFSFRLLDPHPAWLRAVTLTQPIRQEREPGAATREPRTWWTDMLHRKN